MSRLAELLTGDDVHQPGLELPDGVVGAQETTGAPLRPEDIEPFSNQGTIEVKVTWPDRANLQARFDERDERNKLYAPRGDDDNVFVPIRHEPCLIPFGDNLFDYGAHDQMMPGGSCLYPITSMNGVPRSSQWRYGGVAKNAQDMSNPNRSDQGNVDWVGTVAMVNYGRETVRAGSTIAIDPNPWVTIHNKQKMPAIMPEKGPAKFKPQIYSINDRQVYLTQEIIKEALGLEMIRMKKNTAEFLKHYETTVLVNVCKIRYNHPLLIWGKIAACQMAYLQALEENKDVDDALAQLIHEIDEYHKAPLDTLALFDNDYHANQDAIKAIVRPGWEALKGDFNFKHTADKDNNNKPTVTWTGFDMKLHNKLMMAAQHALVRLTSEQHSHNSRFIIGTATNTAEPTRVIYAISGCTA